MASQGDIELPYLTEGYLGKQMKFDSYGLLTLTHEDPFIKMDTDRVEIVIGTTEKTRMTTKMISMGTKKECNEYSLVRLDGANFRFLLRPPVEGFYKFQIYALPSGEAGPQMQGVINYVLFCPGLAADVQPFPKQYPLWKDGCFLYEPLSLPRGITDTGVQFKVYIPKAKDVQMKVGNDWNPLAMTEPGMYEGCVDFSKGYPRDTLAKLNVKQAGNNYNTLLEYKI